jgi:hypothetical protein
MLTLSGFVRDAALQGQRYLHEEGHVKVPEPEPERDARPSARDRERVEAGRCERRLTRSSPPGLIEVAAQPACGDARVPARIHAGANAPGDNSRAVPRGASTVRFGGP